MKCELREVVEARSRPWHSDREDADGRQRVQGKGVGSFGCVTVEAFCNYNIHFSGGGGGIGSPHRELLKHIFSTAFPRPDCNFIKRDSSDSGLSPRSVQ